MTRAKAKPATPNPPPSPEVQLFRKIVEDLPGPEFKFDAEAGEFLVTARFSNTMIGRSTVSFLEAALNLMTELLPMKASRLREARNDLVRSEADLKDLESLLAAARRPPEPPS